MVHLCVTFILIFFFFFFTNKTNNINKSSSSNNNQNMICRLIREKKKKKRWCGRVVKTLVERLRVRTPVRAASSSPPSPQSQGQQWTQCLVLRTRRE